MVFLERNPWNPGKKYMHHIVVHNQVVETINAGEFVQDLEVQITGKRRAIPPEVQDWTINMLTATMIQIVTDVGNAVRYATALEVIFIQLI